MHMDTNHLVSTDGFDEVEMLEKHLAGYEPVPAHLNRAARRALGKNDSVYISKTSGGKLSKHAASRRKAKRKAEKKARYNSKKSGR